MSKGRGPRKRRDAVNEPADSEKEIERQTQEKAELVPPARRPPTAVVLRLHRSLPRSRPGPLRHPVRVLSVALWFLNASRWRSPTWCRPFAWLLGSYSMLRMRQRT